MIEHSVRKVEQQREYKVAGARHYYTAPYQWNCQQTLNGSQDRWYIQTTKVAQVMLDTGNDKLSETMKQLCQNQQRKGTTQDDKNITYTYRNGYEAPCRWGVCWAFFKKYLNSTNPACTVGYKPFELSTVLPLDWQPALEPPVIPVNEVSWGRFFSFD